MFRLSGSELFWDDSRSWAERWYCRMLGVPIVGLRIRLRRLRQLLPPTASVILDAGCGRGVITRLLSLRYPEARVDAVDENAVVQKSNEMISRATGLVGCHYITANLLEYRRESFYDLIVSVDNLEHVENDMGVLQNFHEALQTGGTLLVHVPHFYRRWPVVRWTRNFDVPGHVRPGYHLAELTERVGRAGFTVVRSGFSFGFLENLSNNVSYMISRAQERNRMLYAMMFPVLNSLAWLGQWSRPRFGAGVWIVARKDKQAPTQYSRPTDDGDAE